MLHRNKFKILLPIENIAREFDYKLILSSYLLDRDYEIIIAQHDLLFLISKFIKNGVYIGKNTMTRLNNGKWFSDRHYKIKANNISIFHLDEEGAVYYGREEDWVKKISELRVDKHAFDENDFVLTWGNFQADVFKENTSAYSNKIFCTGHPKFDLLKKKYSFFYETDVRRIKNEFENYILVNTNFAHFNNSLGNKDSLSPRMGYKVDNNDERITSINQWSYVGKTFLDFIKLITALSIEFSDKHFVIRPHPSESLEIYNKIFDDVKNVTVKRDGSVIPWILASDIVIHDGCTTALEAYFATKPIINYHPHHEEKTNLYLPNKVGIKCHDIDSVKEAINNKDNLLQNSNYRRLEEDTLSMSLVKNISNFEDSFHQIKNLIHAEIDKNSQSQVQNFQLKFFMAFSSAINFLKLIFRPLFSEKQKDYLAYKAIFPGFDKKLVKHKISLLNKHSNHIDIKFLSDQIIILNKK